MTLRLLLVGLSLVALSGSGLHAQQPEQPALPPAVPAQQPSPEADVPPPENEGRQRRTSRQSRRDRPATARREIPDGLAPRDGGPTRQTLLFTANVLGGYDDNLTAGLGTGTGLSPSAMTSGYTSSLDGTLDYRRGNAHNDLRIGTTGNLMAYPGYIDTPAAGVAGSMGGKTTVGRRLTFDAGGRVGYEPFFNAFSAGMGTPLPPESGPSTPVAGLFERRSVNSNARVGMDTRLTRRDSAEMSYAFTSQAFLDDDVDEAAATFGAGDSLSQTVGAGYRRVVSRSVRITTDYQYADISYDASLGASMSTRSHRVEGGTSVEHAVARGERSITWSVSGGAARVEALTSAERAPYAAWLPVGSASLTVPFSPTAFVEARYRREFNLFQGVTDDVYATDTAALATSFDVAPRTNLRLVGSFSSWKTPTASGVDDTFKVYGAGTQLRVLLTDSVGLTAAYYYYQHQYSNPAGLPEGFPASYDRNAVRVGLTFLLPVVSPATSRAARPGNP